MKIGLIDARLIPSGEQVPFEALEAGLFEYDNEVYLQSQAGFVYDSRSGRPMGFPSDWDGRKCRPLRVEIIASTILEGE